jgi:hypothetical protein
MAKTKNTAPKKTAPRKTTPGLCALVMQQEADKLAAGSPCDKKRLPMGIAGSPDIFQEKMSNLMATLEFVQTYLDLDDLSIIKNGSLERKSS